PPSAARGRQPDRQDIRAGIRHGFVSSIAFGVADLSRGSVSRDPRLQSAGSAIPGGAAVFAAGRAVHLRPSRYQSRAFSGQISALELEQTPALSRRSAGGAIVVLFQP